MKSLIDSKSFASKTKQNGSMWVLWLPSMFVVIAMSLPLIWLFARSIDAGSDFWDLVLRPRTLSIMLRSISLVIAVTITSALIAVPMAWLTTRTDLPYRKLWGIIAPLPLVIPSYIGAFLVVIALGPKGLLQDGLDLVFGIEQIPSIYGFTGAWLTLSLLSYPYIFLPVRATLSRMDRSIEEASHNLGKGSWSTFKNITLPLLKPSITSGGILVALYTLTDFGAVSILHYETFTWAVYIQFESMIDRSMASIFSLILVLLAILILLPTTLYSNKGRLYRNDPGTPTLPPPIPLGKWRFIATLFCIIVILFSLVIPMSVLTYWLVRGFEFFPSLTNILTATWNTFSIAIIASIMALVSSIPIAILAVRYPNSWTKLLERWTYMGFALPGLVIALALVFFGSQFATPLYQTRTLLVFGYLILFIPGCLGSLQSSLEQINPRLEEAARSLGSGGLKVFLSITLPLLRPGIMSGLALVFLLTAKELPATLILAPIGFSTLATLIWSNASEAFFAQTAAYSLVLILLSSLPMIFLISKRT
ncbi:iron ABC transporter permease [SAR202 cluster bacterium AC-409-J13_OGT_754m]|nr:iron ABC transporter permease [SAR202 cluster bacterium AC-409-J13_OGT_754m]